MYFTLQGEYVYDHVFSVLSNTNTDFPITEQTPVKQVKLIWNTWVGSSEGF